jgi:flagellar biosynthesis/type III secretory pathway protein FliH
VIEAYDEIERFNWTKEQYDAYVRVWMEIDREKCAMEQKYADGEAAGEAKGIEKGIEIGKAEGIELGKAEEKQRAHAKAIESAGKMLACGMSEVEIARFLDLDLAEIEELKERQ